MSDDIKDSEDTADWDLVSVVRRPAMRGRRTIVSVAFPSNEFQLVAAYAESQGMKVSEFIREAALQAAGVRTESAEMGFTGVAWPGPIVVSGVKTPAAAP